MAPTRLDSGPPSLGFRRMPREYRAGCGLVGETPLQRLVPDGRANVAKLEHMTHGGSVKDPTGSKMMVAAER